MAENTSDKRRNFIKGVECAAVPLIIPFREKVADVTEKGLDWLEKKYYAPIFSETLMDQREGEKHQNLIVIVDEARRKNNKTCEGAVGWLSKEKRQEVLNLYDSAVQESGITFLPSAQINTVYWRNPLDRMQYVKVNEFFDFMQENKLAELERIAMMLGAVKCSISYEEQSSKHEEKQRTQKHKTSYIRINAEVDETSEVERDYLSNKEILLTSEFKKSDKPIRPENLKWFEHDGKIKNLIDIVCMGRKLVKKTIVINSDITSIISEADAASIDAAYMKISGGSKLDFKKKVREESKKRLVFTVEF